MVGPIYLTKDFGAADAEGSMYLCTTIVRQSDSRFI